MDWEEGARRLNRCYDNALNGAGSVGEFAAEILGKEKLFLLPFTGRHYAVWSTDVSRTCNPFVLVSGGLEDSEEINSVICGIFPDFVHGNGTRVDGTTAVKDHYLCVVFVLLNDDKVIYGSYISGNSEVLEKFLV
ncbi:hypothetical protein HNY73_012551 [Argiope bruennichi]|uniref:Uncharacterized protein n=1 Tax=Argiope bruennichi TaxID=94029 RepID=A0A8T0EZS5_ARGBR|nr:hypothetical protein HNY73_012551 [Argiope bruennichi]